MIIRKLEDFGKAFSRIQSSKVQQAITPSNANDLAGDIKALYIGGEGSLVIEDYSGNEVTFEVSSGTILPIIPKKVLETSTATNIIALI